MLKISPSGFRLQGRLLKALWLAFGRVFIFTGGIRLLDIALQLLAPFLLEKLLVCIELNCSRSECSESCTCPPPFSLSLSMDASNSAFAPGAAIFYILLRCASASILPHSSTGPGSSPVPVPLFLSPSCWAACLNMCSCLSESCMDPYFSDAPVGR